MGDEGWGWGVGQSSQMGAGPQNRGKRKTGD